MLPSMEIKETGGPPGDLCPSEVSIHRIPRCQSSEPLLRVSGFCISVWRQATALLSTYHPDPSTYLLFSPQARYHSRADKRWTRGDVTELVDQ
ncbi:hypothetical protein R3I93_002723 [Phoxinus phoxinus]|uniref:Uncharacterized protein n=1 Tax=Phoxinus phoxinus TaxID=58324 RepID=A0AAN9HH26_9TELE